MPAYKLQGRTKFQGLDVSIENKKGSVRRWYDPHGKEKGSTPMRFDYGYIRKTKGTDGDHVDVYLGPNPEATHAFIVNQMKKPEDSAKGDGKKWTKFDEQKCMLGFDTVEEAKAAYLKQYNDPRFFGSMRAMPMEKFKEKVLMKENHGKKVASGDMMEYFQKHPQKLKEYKERQAKKVASMWTQVAAEKVARALTGRQKKGMAGEVPVTQEQQLDSPALAVQPSTQTAKMAQATAQAPPPKPLPPLAAAAAPIQERAPAPLSPARAAGMAPTSPTMRAASEPKVAEELDKGTAYPPYIRDRRREGEKRAAGMATGLAVAAKRMKRPDWKLPQKVITPRQAAQKPFSAAAKVAELAVECGLDQYQVDAADRAARGIAKEAGIASVLGKVRGLGKSLLTKAAPAAKVTPKPAPIVTPKRVAGALSLAGVGAAGLGAKKVTDTALELATHPHSPKGPRRARPGPVLI
jgi:hypothetical protein